MNIRREEHYAKDLVERALGRRLIPWDTAGRQGAVDFRAEDTPTISLEVKQVTSADLRVTRSRSNKVDEWRPSSVLSRHWAMTVGPTPPPDIKALVAEAEPLLQFLESWSIDRTRGWLGADDPSEEMLRYKTVYRLRSLLRGGDAMSSEATDELPAGFGFRLGYGLVSTTSENRFAKEIEAWLTGEDGENLRTKLDRSGDEQRHAFLYLDPGHPTNVVGAAHHVAGQLPSEDLQLPEMITHLWIAHPDVLVWIYDTSTGWTDHGI